MPVAIASHWVLFFLVALAVTSNSPCFANYLQNRLKHYEVIGSDRFRRNLEKRGTIDGNPSNYNRIEELVFEALNREFRLVLTPKARLLDFHFKATGISDDGEHVIPFFEDELFAGHVFGAKHSHVSLQIDGDGALMGSVEADDESFIFEPAWRHVDGAALSDTLAYKATDVVFDRAAHETGYIQIDHELVANQRVFSSGEPSNATFGLSTQLPNDTNLDDILAHRRLKRASSNSIDSLTSDQELNSSNIYHHGNGADYVDELDYDDQADESTTHSAMENKPIVYPKNRCPLKLIADYSFFKHIGASSEATTVRYLIGLIDRVNSIFTDTVWRDRKDDAGFTNMGFTIKQIIVLQQPSRIPDHYNAEPFDTVTVANDLLSNFSHFEGSEEFCLVHLFTFRPLKDRVLGLGYIASTEIRLTGGVCSHGKIMNGRKEVCNTALSSLQSSSGGAVITKEADIVTAHELGHNWGAPHDINDPLCNPSVKRGGMYIMNPFSVNGYDPNNRKFSPCSIRSIKAVLIAKHTVCFQEESSAFCGNQRLEPGEECDAGLIGVSGDDPCCTADCKLRVNAKCSPKNHVCCTDECSHKSKLSVCKLPDPLSCKAEAYCSDNGVCSEPRVADDGQQCLDGGSCRSGICKSYCENVGGLKPCMCVNASDSCLRCCLRESVCSPFPNHLTGKPDFLSKGTRCRRGICNGQGKCNEEIQDAVQHLWRIIEQLDGSSLLKFMRDNIVGMVIITTLAVWIPACLVINKIDKQREAEKRRQLEWIPANNFVIGDQQRGYMIEGLKAVSYSPNATLHSVVQGTVV